MRKILSIILLVSGWFFSKSQCPEFLNIDTSICSGAVNITADATFLETQLCGDSLTIFFDATGTVLSGDTNIYMHSGPEFTPYTGWQGNYTVGTWGLNNGVGRMTYIGGGDSIWAITINPRTYYNYLLDSCLNGIFMDFRNYNASIYINNGGANYFLYTITGTPTSTFTNLTGSYSYNTNVMYQWSDGNTDSVRTFTSGVNYTVTATGVGGCSATGSVIIMTAHVPVSLGNDTVRCVANSPVTLNAGSGFVSYTWLDNAASANSTYTAVNPGCYWVSVTDSAGCTSTSEVDVANTEVNNLSIPDSLSTCPGTHLSVDASVNVNLHGDSVIIIYNATLGESQLEGSPKVYMHSGPQLYPGGGWDGTYTVGDWGVDNGVGEMTSLGNNLWRIAIDPYCYYHLPPDSSLNGIWMLFRNADGTEKGLDSVGNNIFVSLAVTPPTSSFSAVNPSRTARLPLTYMWSNGTNGPADSFTTGGIYTVSLSDNNGCSSTASVNISFNGSPAINLGTDTTVCKGDSVVLSAPSGYANYLWSNGATTSSITVDTTSDYSLTVTDTLGCQTNGNRDVTISTSQVSLGNDIVKCTRIPVVITANSGFASYQWLDAPAGTARTYTADNSGPYWIKAIDSAGCASYDTITVFYSDVLGLSLPDSLTSCPGSLIGINAGTSVEQHGDSLVITYNATLGQTGLVGADTVYFHSGPEFYAGTGWQGNYTVGDWGVDNGVGLMTSLGNNMWQIVIEPYTYYHINPDTPLSGIYMVFRNQNGSETGKDDNGNNIYLVLTGPTPVSAFNGVTGYRKSAGSITYLWSNASAADSIAVGTAGFYAVTVSDIHGCSNSDSTLAVFTNTLSVNLGNDTGICPAQTVVLNPGSGFGAYRWNTGDTTATLTVTTTGTYSVTVTTGTCSASDSVTVTVSTHVVSIGSDTVRCNTSPITLTASGGFVSYLWFGSGPSGNTYTAVNAGNYWVAALDSSGCNSSDTITVSNSPVTGLSLPDSLLSCGGDTVSANASISINANGDSITIIYNATQGQSGLVGANSVYMHSAPQFTLDSTNWNLPYTVGNWGQNDGLGEMSYYGPNQWQITIDPYTYYNVPGDTPLLGIFMVFRSADGDQTGKDNNGNNILLSLGTSPSSTFTGVTGSWKAGGELSYDWSNGVTTPLDQFTTGGTYKVTVSDQHGCSDTASTKVFASPAVTVNLGPDTTVCPDSTIILNAPGGFASYVWSTGASTPYLYVSATGTYYLTVTDTIGCAGSDSITVDSCNTTIVVGCGSPVAKFRVESITESNTVTFIDSSLIVKPKSYLWEFGDGTSDTTMGSTVHTYAAPGIYSVTLVITDSCGGVDSESIQVNVNATGIMPVSGLSSVNIYPNPAASYSKLELNLEQTQMLEVSLINSLGEIIWNTKQEFAAGKTILKLETNNLADGVYAVKLNKGSEEMVIKLIVTR